MGNSRFKHWKTRLFYSSHVVKTLPIYYFMLLECMCEVSKLLIIQNPRKLSLKKKFKKRLNTEFPILCENWTIFSITVNRYFLPLQSNFHARLKAVLHFVFRRWIIMIIIWRFHIRHLNIMVKLHTVIQEKVENGDMCFYNCHIGSY